MPADLRYGARNVVRRCIEAWQPTGSLGEVISAVEELRTARAIQARAELRELFFAVDVPHPLDQPRRSFEYERLRDRLLAALCELEEPADQSPASPIDVLQPNHQDGRAMHGAQTPRLTRITKEATSEAARAWALYHLARTDPIAAWPTLIDAFERSPRWALGRDEQEMIANRVWRRTEGFERTRRCQLAVTSALRFRDDRAVNVMLWTLAKDPTVETQVRFWALASLSKRPIGERFDFGVPTSDPLPAELRNDIVLLYLPGDPLRKSLVGSAIHPDIDFRWLIERMHLPLERKLPHLVGTPSVRAYLEAGLFLSAWQRHRLETEAAVTSALKSALESAGYGVVLMNDLDDPYLGGVMDVSFADHKVDSSNSDHGHVGVWLSPVGAYATASPYPTTTEEDGWVTDDGGWDLVERISHLASGVADMHGWHWLDSRISRTVLPGFHFERRSMGGQFLGDEPNPSVLDLLFWGL